MQGCETAIGQVWDREHRYWMGGGQVWDEDVQNMLTDVGHIQEKGAEKTSEILQIGWTDVEKN